MSICRTCIIAAVLTGAALVAGADSGLVAHWNFNEGTGDILHDRSGNNNQGKIHGAKWVQSGSGYALQFDGVDNYVDCGNAQSLDITGPITLQSWIMPTAVNRGEPGIIGKFFESYALTYHGSVFFYISSGGNNVSCPVQPGKWFHVAATFDGAVMCLYLNGLEVAVKKSHYDTIGRKGRFTMGCIIDSTSADPNLQNTAFFPGLIDDVRVHNRVLTAQEIIKCYNDNAGEKGLNPFDVRQFGRFALEPFFYPDDESVVLSVNYRWVLPLPDNARMVVELAKTGSPEPLFIRGLAGDDNRCEAEAAFSTKGLPPGDYELRALVQKPDIILPAGENVLERIERVAFRLPFDLPPAPLPPAKKTAASLPPPVIPPAYRVSVQLGGGLIVQVKDQSFPIESSYSYPDGGFNCLTAGAADVTGEPEWKVRIQNGSGKTLRITAAGKFYQIDRTVHIQPSRILVRDTIRNTWNEVLGIMLSNHVNLRNVKDAQVTEMRNPTIFAARKSVGVGLIALDDLYQLRQETMHNDGLAEIRDHHFGLDVGASCTVEWAIYPTDTVDYYDFINQVRKDEGLNGHVAGGFSFTERRNPPSPEFVEMRNAAYLSIGCLGKPLDNPATPLEGIEFMEYPKECAALKDTFARTKTMFPGKKVMFHVAHSLYICNNPNERFPDSRAIDANGLQMHYGPNSFDYYGGYISQEMFNDNWRWWTFYPTEQNSFGKAMIAAMEYMVGGIGATGMWADGYIFGYVEGAYSYDCWDGRSVTIDPRTARYPEEEPRCLDSAASPETMRPHHQRRRRRAHLQRPVRPPILLAGAHYYQL